VNLSTVLLVLSASMAMSASPPATPAAEPITIDVTPQVTHSPGDVRATAFVQRDRDNRKLTFVAMSDSFYRSSTRELDGMNASRVHVMVFRGLPAGTYDVEARVTKSDGRELSADITVSVLGEAQRP